MRDVHTLGKCPQCGRPLSQDAPEGLCARCVLKGVEDLSAGGLDEAPTLSSADGAARGRHLAENASRLTPGEIWGPYRIGRLLGKGGMGEVYEAEHMETGRRLALKVLRSRLENADDRARFLREGQLAASVSHPHTVYIFGSEEIAGAPVISMELVPGGALKDRVATEGPLAPVEAVSAVLGIIGGLDAAQAAGILHRDIKPSNCFIDSDGSIKVGDFGLSISTLARDVRHELDGVFQGTPQFASPEQLRGEPLDVRADIYAVGATLYYLLTGQPPFDAPDLHTLAGRVMNEQPQSPRVGRPEIPAGLAAVVMQCLAKTPADRPSSYAALADALRPYALQQRQPAPPGLRILAGMFDSILTAAPVSIWFAWTGDVMIRGSAGPAASAAWAWLVNVAYYFFLEGLWGASLGKRLVGLRVLNRDGARASWRSIAARTAVFHFPNLLLGGATLGGFLMADTMPAFLRATGTLGLVTALFLTARRSNGWAGIHDLVSGTRVASRSTAASRRLGASPHLPLAAQPMAGGGRYGPFVGGPVLWESNDGRLIAGFDPILRRPVWIRTAPPGTPPISSVRRELSRSGRLFWLTGRRSASENWDAFEAPGGEALLTRTRTAVEWPTLKLWLVDLANELAAGARDGSTPALALDRLWIRNDGRLVLLDFPAPGASKPDEAHRADLTPVALLSAAAAHAISTGGNLPMRPDFMPLSARTLLDRLSRLSPPPLDDARAELVRVAGLPDRVRRRRRSLPIALASLPTAFILGVALLALPAFFGFMRQNGELLELLGALNQPNPPAQSRLRDPAIRDAMETYVAGRYGGVLNNDAFWDAAIMQGLQPMRRTAEQILARHSSVSAEELERASAIIAPELARMSRRRSDDFAQVAGVILVALAALSLLIAVGCSLLASILVPGGAVAKLLGLAVVTRDGREVRRGRSLVRAIAAWLPAIVWLAYLAASPKVQGWVPAPGSPLAGLSLVLSAMAIGAICALASPNRGLHDRLTGTWVIPR